MRSCLTRALLKSAAASSNIPRRPDAGGAGGHRRARAVRRRPPRADAAAHCPPAAPRRGAAAHRVPRSGRRHRPHASQRPRRARGRVRRQRDSARSRAPVDPGHRPGRAAGAPARASIRNVAYALLSGADGWMFDGEDALGQVDDDVARQPAQPEAGVRTAIRVFLRRRRAGRRRDERVGARRSSAARIVRRLAARSSTSRRGSSARAACTSTTATSGRADGRGFSASIVDAGALRREQPRAAAGATGASLVLYLPKIQTAEEAALWNDMLTRSKRTSACRRARSRSTCSSSRSRPVSS